MRKVARSFFPEEGVVRDMDIRAENVGVLKADISSAVPQWWRNANHIGRPPSRRQLIVF